MKFSKRQTVALASAAAGCALLGWNLMKRRDVKRRNRSIPPKRRILILGAGFAGLNVAQELCRLLPDADNGRITLVDQNNYLLFTPMLTEVAGGELDLRHILASPRSISRRLNFEQGRVLDIDLQNKSVVLDSGNDGSTRRTLGADHLVIAMGSTPNFHGIPGIEEHSLGIKSIRDAAAIRSRVLESLERASWEQDAEIRRASLTFIVGGGGYTGVETIAAINDLVRTSARKYPKLSAGEIRTVIIEPGDRLLTELSPDLAAYAQKKLEEHGVEIRLKTRISRAEDEYVELQSGERIRTRALIWAGGIVPNPLIRNLDCQHGKHGGIVVDQYCEVPGHAGVWALGDCAEVPKSDSQDTYAPTAQNATREGAQVGRNIVAALRGEKPEAFTYTPIGEMALVGRHSGVAKLYGSHFAGFLAWAMWRAFYVSQMPGMAQRSRIVIDWILDSIFGRNIAELPVDRPVSTRG